MPSKMRQGLLISFVVISLIVISFHTSYADTTNYIYDELNRLTRVEYGDGTKILYAYDQAGNRSQVYIGNYTLAVNVVGSGTVTKNPDQPIYIEGTSVTLTAVNGSQTFSEWSGDLTGNTNPSTLVMDGNKSVTATFVTTVGWLQGWTYRKAVTLSRASGAVTNYQMRLLVGETPGASGENVDCNGHCRTDFNDLRFTTSDGQTLLDYWVESITATTPNQLATVWIEFDSIGTGDTIFYMYYGKADATAYSNGANTFIKFDDFERGSDGDALGGNWQNVGNAKISTDHAYGGTRSGKIPYNGTNPYLTSSICAAEKAVMLRMWKETLVTGMYLLWGISANYNCRAYGNTNEDIYYLDSASHDTGYNMVADTWGLWEIYDVNVTTHVYSLKYNGTGVATGVGMNPAGFGALGVYNPDTTSGHDFYIDNVIIRNYRNPEPAWGSWGTEQAN